MNFRTERAEPSAQSVFITKQTRLLHAISISLGHPHETSTARKSSPGLSHPGIFGSLSIGSEIGLQGGKTSSASGAVVDFHHRHPALSTHSFSSRLCVSSPPQRSAHNIARTDPAQSARISIHHEPRYLHHLPRLRPKIRV